MKKVKIGKVVFGGPGLAFIAGPCVIESRAGCVDLAKRLVALSKKLNAQLVFKASFDKANRSAISAFRGPGLVEGLEILQEIKESLGVPICTDIHEPAQAVAAAMVAPRLAAVSSIQTILSRLRRVSLRRKLRATEVAMA